MDHLAREKVERIEDRHATVRWLLDAKGELGAPEQEGVDAPLRGDAREHGVKRLVRLLRHARDRLEPPARVVDRLVQPLLVVLSREDHCESRRREPCGQCTGLQGPVCAEQADAPGRSLAEPGADGIDDADKDDCGRGRGTSLKSRRAGIQDREKNAGNGRGVEVCEALHVSPAGSRIECPVALDVAAHTTRFGGLG